MEEKTDKSEEASEEQTSESSEEEQEEPTEEQSEEEESQEEEETPTVPLSDFTRTKDVLHRMADMVIADEDKLAELTEDDPKLLERLKGEFPKKFKDVKIPAKVMSDEDIDAKVDAAVAKRLKSSGKSDVLESLQKELNMTDMEFLDIKETLSEKADHYLKIEFADNVKDAVMLAYKNLDSKKYKELVQKQVVKDISKRKEVSKTGAGGSGDIKKYPKKVLDNYKKLGFEDPAEMVKYQNEDVIDIFE